MPYGPFSGKNEDSYGTSKAIEDLQTPIPHPSHLGRNLNYGPLNIPTLGSDSKVGSISKDTNDGAIVLLIRYSSCCTDT